jgi:hypothetical protein
MIIVQCVVLYFLLLTGGLALTRTLIVMGVFS